MFNLCFLFFLLFVAHFYADYMFQSDKMALNKSHSLKWLTLHALAYGGVTLGFLLLVFADHLDWFIWYTIVLTLTHWLIDFGTSRWAAYLWKKEDRHNFFVVLGLDQLLHLSTILFLVSTN